MFEHINVRKVKIVMCVSMYLLVYNQNRSETNLLFTKTYSVCVCVCVFTSQLFKKSCSVRAVCRINTVKTIVFFFPPWALNKLWYVLGSFHHLSHHFKEVAKEDTTSWV